MDGRQDISIHAPLTRCDIRFGCVCRELAISIHAPLTRCDLARQTGPIPVTNFNPRTSHEVRPTITSGTMTCELFQSTHLSRGATPMYAVGTTMLTFQSTHLSRGATEAADRSRERIRFQSTHLSRGATDFHLWIYSQNGISIHAPLTRCDQSGYRHGSFSPHFNPRTSHEVRPSACTHQTPADTFQSTHLSRGATIATQGSQQYLRISIHAPLTRCDKMFRCLLYTHTISIHAPLTRCDEWPQ